MEWATHERWVKEVHNGIALAEMYCGVKRRNRVLERVLTTWPVGLIGRVYVAIKTVGQ